MTCRHRPGDPDCGSTAGGYRAIENERQTQESHKRELKRQKDEAAARIVALEAQIAAASPDASRFEIDEVEAVGPHLVVRALFPNCAKCAFEGKKVLVYLNTGLKDVLKWRRLDPHFRDSGVVSTDSTVSCLIVKGISDFADEDHRDDSPAQRSAACENAMRLVLESLENATVDEEPILDEAKR